MKNREYYKDSLGHQRKQRSSTWKGKEGRGREGRWFAWLLFAIVYHKLTKNWTNELMPSWTKCHSMSSIDICRLGRYHLVSIRATPLFRPPPLPWLPNNNNNRPPIIIINWGRFVQKWRQNGNFLLKLFKWNKGRETPSPPKKEEDRKGQNKRNPNPCFTLTLLN